MSHLDYEVKDKLVQLERNSIIIQVSQLHPCQLSIDVFVAFTILRELHVTVCRWGCPTIAIDRKCPHNMGRSWCHKDPIIDYAVYCAFTGCGCLAEILYFRAFKRLHQQFHLLTIRVQCNFSLRHNYKALSSNYVFNLKETQHFRFPSPILQRFMNSPHKQRSHRPLHLTDRRRSRNEFFHLHLLLKHWLLPLLFRSLYDNNVILSLLSVLSLESVVLSS